MTLMKILLKWKLILLEKIVPWFLGMSVLNPKYFGNIFPTKAPFIKALKKKYLAKNTIPKQSGKHAQYHFEMLKGIHSDNPSILTTL